MTTDEILLLDLLNTTPVRNGTPEDDLADARVAREWLASHGQPATDDEHRTLLDARSVLQAIVRGQDAPAAAARFLDDVTYRASFGDDGVEWVLDVPAGRSAAARAVLAWDALAKSSPGRLRPCANPECRLFLIDHSKPNSARWCSMAACGNRMKARRHYQRSRIAAD
ncbi:CGNR zinc finger domain-containing protein [Amycolatopsis mongoliensis]|uniref:CGNR zinc finger domain-containing protein n=1 Tax=Amycolatopsis mongoliensis TaxID=715475 RepID=A0A9Y2JKA0_9PSEU|nr:CGNR zinc finger domain-containing protein [Amycolatopsis sp. 4-36]WIX98826.1 CGNR zinc finger domain-containing protein [Amycolatopsis sp. 4-36]